MFYIFHIVPLTCKYTGQQLYMPLAVTSRAYAFTLKSLVRPKNPDLYKVSIVDDTLFVQSNINKTIQHTFFLDKKEVDLETFCNIVNRPSIVVSIQPMTKQELIDLCDKHYTSADVDVNLSKIMNKFSLSGLAKKLLSFAK